MLVVPHGQDQPDNARRCAQLGVGRTLNSESYTVSRVTKELSELLSNSSYRDRAVEVGREVIGEDGTKTACDAIERVLV